MTLQTLPHPIAWPGVLATGWTANPAGQSSALLDAAGEYEAMVMVAAQDMVVSHVAWRPSAVVGSPTADVRIETVDASGIPSGTLWAANTNVVTGTLTAALTLNALTASATINKGQIFAVKFAYNSGTSLVIRTINNLNALNLPYRVANQGAAAKGGATATIMALGSNSTTFYAQPFCWPCETFSNNTFANTNSAARALRFQVPFSCRCIGFNAIGGTSNGDFNAVLWDDSGAELSSSSTAYDGDDQRLTAGLMEQFFFDNAVTLSPGTFYRIGKEPSTATVTNWYNVTLLSSDYRQAMPGGVNFQDSTRASGTWTDSTTIVPWLDILIDQLDDGVGGGGSTGISRARGAAGFA